MPSRLSFVIETMEVIDGQKLKSLHPDKDGYYDVPLAVVGAVTQNKTYYIPEAFIDSMVGPNSPFALQVRSGNMFGEYGHPFTKDLERLGIVLEEKQSHHIKKIYTRDLPDGTILIMGLIRPFGPYGKFLEESFAVPSINTAFSLRSLCTETLNRQMQRIDRTIKYFVTYDSVGSSGYKQSSKRYARYGLENAKFCEESFDTYASGDVSFELNPNDLIAPSGDIVRGFESLTTISDTWLTDLFGAREIRITSKSIPVNARHLANTNSVVTDDGKKLNLVRALWR